MRVIIKKDYDECAKWTADYIAGRIYRAEPTEANPFVLGLPTGSTPLGVYRRLIELNAKGCISFKNVITFNMDEYSNLDESHPQSYHYFMHENFFSKIDIKKENIHILDGTARNPQEECQHYEDLIRQVGGIDLFLGGCGCDGHIAFNEPGSSLVSRTRMKTLTEDTIMANARFFGGDCSQVPRTALTVGIGTITDAKEVLIMMTGLSKAEALQHAVEESVSQMWPVTILQMHRNSMIIADDACTDMLRVGTVKYFNGIEAKIKDSYESLFSDK
ncbi:MAG: glucosamine-6-phosphate deaminase [Treponema sp.]|nr:glucosamine-6-phosphate deaminase [Treponema sp.]